MEKPYAGFGAKWTGFCGRETAGFDRILDNSITDYRGREASIDVARVSVVDPATAEEHRKPSGRLDFHQTAGPPRELNTHLSRMYSVCTWDIKSASSVSTLEANRRKGLQGSQPCGPRGRGGPIHIQQPHDIRVCGRHGRCLKGRARLGALE